MEARGFIHVNFTTNADGRPEEILRSVRSAVDDFVGDAEKFDDITMMCIEYCGSESPSL